MSIWNKVMLPMIVLLAIFATLWSAQELKIQSTWGEAIAKLGAAREKAERDMERLMNNADELPQWEVREHALVSDVAENWRDCDPTSVRNNDGQVEVKFTLATPGTSGMNMGAVVYIFDQRSFQDGGRFLGRFQLTQIVENRIEATSFDLLEPDEIRQIEQSFGDKAKWSVHSQCPKDRPDFFVSDSDRRKYLPENVLELYTQEDYQPVDFGFILARFYQYRIENREQLATAQNEYQAPVDSQEIADRQLREYRNEIDETNQQIAVMDAQRQEVGVLTQQLDHVITDMKTQAQKTQTQNETLVLEIERLQRKTLTKMR